MVRQHVDTAVTPATREGHVADGRPPARADRAGRTRIWVLLLLVAGYLLHVGWRLWLSRHLDAPAAHADEDAYLITARALAGGPGGGTTENEAFRRLGYPLMLSPVYWLTSDAFTVYRGALAINAVLNALMFPLAYLFGRRVLALSTPVALAAGFVAAALPAVVFYSEFALTDAVLAPIATGWLLLLHGWLTAATARARLVAALGAGALAGLFYAVHVRGLVVAAVHCLLAAALVLLRRTTWRLGAAAVGAAALAAGLDPALKLAIRGEISTWGRSPRSQTIDAFTTLSGIGRMLGGADGQLWYLAVATLGLGAVGIVAAAMPLADLRGLRGRIADPVDGGRDIVVLTTLATTVLIALSSAAALPPADNRINYFAYPRYIHMLFPVWLLIGLAALLAAGTGRRATRLAVGGAAVTLATAAVVYIRLQFVGWAAFQPFDAPEIMMLGWRWNAIGIAQPTAVALTALAAIALLLRPPRRGLPAVFAGVLLLQVANMVLVTERVSERMVDPQYTATTPRIVRDGYVRPGDKVAFAWRQQPTWYTQYNHMREIYWTRLELFDQTAQPIPAQANVVIAPWTATGKAPNWDGARHGFRLVVTDPEHGWAVWRRG